MNSYIRISVRVWLLSLLMENLPICVECDVMSTYYCKRCKADFCSKHCQTHYDTKLCNVCDTHICIEMFDNFDEPDLEDTCFRCIARDKISSLQVLMNELNEYK